MNLLEYLNSESDAEGVSAKDFLFNIAAIFLSLFILLLPFINDPIPVTKEINSPGALVVEIFWPDGYYSDVDLWILGPDNFPVGYRNKHSGYFDLLRDDVGKTADSTNNNSEVAFSRGVLPGRYRINVALYYGAEGEAPIPVTVIFSRREPGGRRVEILLSRQLSFNRTREEQTAFVFTIDENGNIIPGSISYDFVCIFCSSSTSSIPDGPNDGGYWTP